MCDAYSFLLASVEIHFPDNFISYLRLNSLYFSLFTFKLFSTGFSEVTLIMNGVRNSVVTSFRKYTKVDVV